jgi:hypothetical protein
MGLLQKLNEALDSRCYEPKKRLVGGEHKWAQHRFPIKGGISFREVIIRNFYEPHDDNLLKQLMEKKDEMVR